jgi:methyl-accepting chemotaxis protein
MINRIRRNGSSAAFPPGTLPDMAQPPDLEGRVAALENRVEELTQRVQGSERDAAAARVLAGGADRDVEQIRGEIRDFKQATTVSFNAMREDINDLRTEMRSGFAEMRSGFAEVDRGFVEMCGRLDATAAGIEQIANMLGRQGGEHRPDGPA